MLQQRGLSRYSQCPGKGCCNDVSGEVERIKGQFLEVTEVLDRILDVVGVFKCLGAN